MMWRRRERLERLLANGRLGGPERGRIFDRAVTAANVGGRSAGWWWRRWAIRLSPVAVGLTVAVVLLRPQHTADEFRGKGVGAQAPRVEAICTLPDGAGCRRQGKLVIRVESLPAAAYLVGYVTPAGSDSEAARRWFSPATSVDPALRIDGDEAPQILPHGISLDAFEPGRYDVHLRLLAHPASRSEALGMTALAHSTTPLTVLP